MLRQVMSLVLQDQAKNIRRRVILAGAIALLLFLSVVFALVALFLWLATRHEPWLAALIVVSILLVTALFLWGVGRIGNRARSRMRVEHQIQAALDAALATDKDDASIVTLATALTVGFAVGRGIAR